MHVDVEIGTIAERQYQKQYIFSQERVLGAIAARMLSEGPTTDSQR